MPIVFAQPQPVSPTISAEAGRTEQFDRMAPILQRQQEAVAQAYAQQYATSARIQSDNADRGQRGAEFAATANARADAGQLQAGQDAAQMQFKANMAQQAEQSQMAEMRERAKLQMEVQAAELTHKDKIELNRLQMALGSIQNNPDLSAEEKNHLTTMVQAKVDPYQQRLVKTRIQQEQMQTKQMEESLALQHIITERQKQFAAKSLPERIETLTDPTTGVTGQFYLDKNGDPHPIFDKLNEQAMKAKEAQAAQQEKAAIAAETGQRKHQERVDEHAHKRGLAFLQIDKEATHAAERAARESSNPNFDTEEYKRVRVAQGEAAYDRANPTPKAAGQQPGTGSVNGPAPEDKPFQYTNPKSQTVAQRAVVGQMNQGVEAVLSSAAPREVKDEAFQTSQQIGMMLGKYGSTAAMEAKDPRAYAEFVDLTKKMNAAIKRAKDAAPAQAPPADARSDKQKFEQGDLVTAQGVRAAAATLTDKLRKGELVTAEELLGKSPDGRSVFQRFDQGDLVTIRGILDVLNNASPFNKRK